LHRLIKGHSPAPGPVGGIGAPRLNLSRQDDSEDRLVRLDPAPDRARPGIAIDPVKPKLGNALRLGHRCDCVTAVHRQGNQRQCRMERADRCRAPSTLMPFRQQSDLTQSQQNGAHTRLRERARQQRPEAGDVGLWAGLGCSGFHAPDDNAIYFRYKSFSLGFQLFRLWAGS
jgi:hypothetical protein